MALADEDKSPSLLSGRAVTRLHEGWRWIGAWSALHDRPLRPSLGFSLVPDQVADEAHQPDRRRDHHAKHAPTTFSVLRPISH